VPIPIFLGAGLNPENVGRAINQVAPFGVDVWSGLPTDGRLDEIKLAAFKRAVRDSGVPAPWGRAGG